MTRTTPVPPAPYSIRHLAGPNDPAWPEWRDIYLASFPANERMSLDYILGRLEGDNDGERLLAMTTPGGGVAGIATYVLRREPETGYLGYLATNPARRSQGLGAALYADVVRRTRGAGARMLVFEVEIPELADTPDAAEWARRRIGWYRRQGAKLLHGARVSCEVDGDFPPLDMLLMVHPFAPMDAAEALIRATETLGDRVAQTGVPRLD